VLASRAYGDFSQEYVDALVRNAHERAVYRIEPISARSVVIQHIKAIHLDGKYNERAPARFKI